MTNLSRKTDNYILFVYLLLANGITWLCWIPGLVLSSRQGYIMPNFDTYSTLFALGFTDSRHMWLAIAFQFGVYGPLIGGLAATWMSRGKEGLKDLWERIIKINIAGHWYFIAIIITFALTGIPVVIFALTGNFVLSTVPITYILFVFVAQLLTSGLGEEPGWRGFLLSHLKEHFGGERYIWILGLLWAIWHFPIVISQTLSMMQNATALQMGITILMALAGQTMTLIGMTYIYVWMYNNTSSIFLMIVFHAFSNLFSTWLPTFLSNPQAIGLLPALMPWAVVIILQKKLGKDQFPG